VDLELQGKVVVVTAGGAGIGLAIVRAFAAEGAHVVTADLRIDAIGPVAGVDALELDMTRPDSPAKLAAAAMREHGGIDVLVNCLGGPRPQPDGFLAISDEAWMATFQLNFFTMARMARAVVPVMRERGGGAIVNIASDLARQPDPVFADYAAAKAAVLSLSKSLSIEFGPEIRCNALSPGPTRTPGLESDFSAAAAADGRTLEEAIADYVNGQRRMASRRLGEPEEVAGVAVFLASARAAQVTGAEWTVDGGVLKAA
jgi:NAD(P)-dependent dehydrogenase (short-subunit alcohol dehydrogenase family)